MEHLIKLHLHFTHEASISTNIAWSREEFAWTMKENGNYKHKSQNTHSRLPNSKCILSLEFVPWQSIGCKRLRFSRHPQQARATVICLESCSTARTVNLHDFFQWYSMQIFTQLSVCTAECCALLCQAAPSNDRHKNAPAGGRLYSWSMSRLKWISWDFFLKQIKWVFMNRCCEFTSGQTPLSLLFAFHAILDVVHEYFIPSFSKWFFFGLTGSSCDFHAIQL